MSEIKLVVDRRTRDKTYHLKTMIKEIYYAKISDVVELLKEMKSIDDILWDLFFNKEKGGKYFLNDEMKRIREEISEKLRLFYDPVVGSHLYWSIRHGRENLEEKVLKKLKNRAIGRNYYRELLPYFSTLLECMKLIIEKDEDLARKLNSKLHELSDDERYLVKLTLKAYKYIDIDKNSINERLLRLLCIDDKTIETYLYDIEKLKNIVQEKIAKTERLLRKSKNPENVVLWKLNREISRIFKDNLYSYVNNLIYVLIIEDFINYLRKEVRFFSERIDEYGKYNDEWYKERVKKYKIAKDYIEGVIERFKIYKEELLTTATNEEFIKTIIEDFIKTRETLMKNGIILSDTDTYGYYLFMMLQKNPKLKEEMKENIKEILSELHKIVKFQEDLREVFDSFIEYIQTKWRDVSTRSLKARLDYLNTDAKNSIFYGFLILRERYLDHIYDCAMEYLSNFIENEMTKYGYGNKIVNILLGNILDSIVSLLKDNYAFHICPARNYVKKVINNDEKGLKNIELAMKYLLKILENKDLFSKFELEKETKEIILKILTHLHLYLVTIDDEDMRKDLQRTILKLTEIFPPLDKNIAINTLPSKYSRNFDLRMALTFYQEYTSALTVKYEKYEDLTVPVPDYSIENNKELYNRLCTIGKEVDRFLKYLDIIFNIELFKDYTLNCYKASIWLSLIISEIIENNNIERVIELLRDIFSHEHINEIILTPELNESIRNAINYLIKQKEETTNEHIKEEIDNIVKLIEERLNYPVEKLVPVAVEQ